MSKPDRDSDGGESRVETKVVTAGWEVDRRLKELRLNRHKLLGVAAAALAERANATPFHAANAAGTLAYQHGTFALRDKFVPDGFDVDRTDGIESIRSDTLKIKVAFQNVDIACNVHHLPRPRSEKGAGAERAASGNLFGSLPHFAPVRLGGFPLWYLMVDDDGNLELTLPVVGNNTFIGAVERLFLGNIDDDDGSLLDMDTGDMADNYDPVVARK